MSSYDSARPKAVPFDVAIALTPEERQGIVEAFFSRQPGASAGAFGLGRAVLDFQAWEIASGRIAEDGGSAWWRAVNGLMVLDIAAASANPAAVTGPVRAWIEYASASEAGQAALWEAHQRSLHTAVRRCTALLEDEAAAERVFAGIVVDVVDRTAVAGSATDTSDLAQLTKRFYPASYPVTQEDLAGLEILRARTAERLRERDGTVIANVGIDSSRWD
jgi:hypothetical protein